MSHFSTPGSSTDGFRPNRRDRLRKMSSLKRQVEEACESLPTQLARSKLSELCSEVLLRVAALRRLEESVQEVEAQVVSLGEKNSKYFKAEALLLGLRLQTARLLARERQRLRLACLNLLRSSEQLDGEISPEP